MDTTTPQSAGGDTAQRGRRMRVRGKSRDGLPQSTTELHDTRVRHAGNTR
ncbi:hypothetical protein HMPREF0970_00320 [Schaalia odontolytica F0309]|uniref:Uncharacterized protein n=1 Tax=Schaalia odontolytica F0309 TaxID=649742 RepID=D4TWL0_9ACTO|nr:hypothetical protein HMPREF0970_00320 [Schaalia odontolytica F0309]